MNVVRRWWRRRRAARHEPWCPVSFAFIPTWAVNPSTTPPGEKVRILHPPQRCAGCPADVWWYVADQLSTRGRLYCSPECRHRAGNPEPSKQPPVSKPCPRPRKLAFASREDAEERFHTLLTVDPDFEVYRCVCLMWHGGHPRTKKPDPAQRIGAIARFGKLRRPA